MWASHVYSISSLRRNVSLLYNHIIASPCTFAILYHVVAVSIALSPVPSPPPSLHIQGGYCLHCCITWNNFLSCAFNKMIFSNIVLSLCFSHAYVNFMHAYVDVTLLSSLISSLPSSLPLLPPSPSLFVPPSLTSSFLM